MTITHVQLFSVPVADQDIAKTFYLDVLGFELVNDVPMGPDARWVQVRPVGAATSLTLVTWFDEIPPGSLTGVVLETGDLDASIADLEAKGVVFEGGVIEEPWGRFATFSDPDGNRFILQTTSMV